MGIPNNIEDRPDIQYNFEVLDGQLVGLNSRLVSLETKNPPASAGSSIISTTGTRTNVAYGALSDGPDQVTNVVLPTNGLIFVLFKALWSCGAGTAGAAIFLGANQLKVGGIGVPVVQEVTVAGAVNDSHLATDAQGLITASNTGLASTHVTTGMAVAIADAGAGTGTNKRTGGGPVPIFADPGTYTVSVQFKMSAGAVTVKDRRLWVWTRG